MSEEKKSILMQNLASLSTPENFQRYILGTKGNGDPRAIYDIIKDYTRPHKKKKKKKGKKGKHKGGKNTYSLYLDVKKGKNHGKHWHI